MDKREQKRRERVERIRNWFNIDNIIDASVDLFLILFDVLSSPILIVMRLARFVIGNYLLGGVKNKIKRVAHWTNASEKSTPRGSAKTRGVSDGENKVMGAFAPAAWFQRA